VEGYSARRYIRRMDECCSAKSTEIEQLARRGDQRRVLWLVMAINTVMFVAEFAAGLIAGSVALVADSVDMLGDALVYVVSLFALERSERWRAGAALAKGIAILVFGTVVVIEVGAKFVHGGPPASGLMFAFGSLALAANLTCLRLLWRFRDVDVNMSSTFECSRNDVISNVGVLVAAAGVLAFNSAWPDIIVGLMIGTVFFRSAGRVIREAWPQFRSGVLVRDPAE
jgi:cation diffusion facilitator family transporter